jgi:hypothetical protein
VFYIINKWARSMSNFRMLWADMGCFIQMDRGLETHGFTNSGSMIPYPCP